MLGVWIFFVPHYSFRVFCFPSISLLDNTWPRSYGLQSLTQHFLKRNLAKPFRVKVSNWNAETLTDDQVGVLEWIVFLRSLRNLFHL